MCTEITRNPPQFATIKTKSWGMKNNNNNKEKKTDQPACPRNWFITSVHL